MRWLIPLVLIACSSTKNTDDTASMGGPDGGEGPSGDDTAGSGDPSADSDGDGYTDEDERSENTDPLDPDDHPYLGGWPIDACRDLVQPTGARAGDIANGWSRMDQFGEEISLHDFCDHTVLLVGSAFW